MVNFDHTTMYILLILYSWDSLTIFDGGSNTSPMLGKRYCGDSLPRNHISSRNQLFIDFHSDHVVTETGFKLEYNATSKNSYKVGNCKIVIVLPGC